MMMRVRLPEESSEKENGNTETEEDNSDTETEEEDNDDTEKNLMNGYIVINHILLRTRRSDCSPQFTLPPDSTTEISGNETSLPDLMYTSIMRRSIRNKEIYVKLMHII